MARVDPAGSPQGGPGVTVSNWTDFFQSISIIILAVISIRHSRWHREDGR